MNMRTGFHPFPHVTSPHSLPGRGPLRRKALCLFMAMMVPFWLPALPAYPASPSSGNTNPQDDEDLEDATPTVTPTDHSTSGGSKQKNRTLNPGRSDLDKKIYEEETNQPGSYPKVVIGPGDLLSIQVYDEIR